MSDNKIRECWTCRYIAYMGKDYCGNEVYDCTCEDVQGGAEEAWSHGRECTAWEYAGERKVEDIPDLSNDCMDDDGDWWEEK